jgi:hypothetical protein
MGFDELTKSLIKDINDLNTFIKDNKIENEINIKNILDKVISQEKEYSLLKHNLDNSKNNLEKNIELLKKKCDIEYKIYETLMDHKTKLNDLKTKNNETELPSIDNFTKKLFNVEPIIQNEKQTYNKHDNSSKNNEHKRFSGNILQDQLNAAIISRRGAVDGEDECD